MSLELLRRSCIQYLKQSVSNGIFAPSYPTRLDWVTVILNHQQGESDQDILVRLQDFLEEYDNKIWYQRWWAYATQPIGRLKQYHSVALLLQKLNDREPVETYQQRIGQAIIYTRKHFWFFSEMTHRLNNAQAVLQNTFSLHANNRSSSTMLPIDRITQSLRSRFQFSQQTSSEVPINTPPSTTTIMALNHVLMEGNRKLKSFGNEWVWETFPPKYRKTLANEAGYLTEQHCLEARRSITKQDLFNYQDGPPGYLGRFNPSLSHHDYTLLYYRSLQLRLMACISALANENEEQTIAELNSLYRLLKETNMIANKTNNKTLWAISYDYLFKQIGSLTTTYAPTWLQSWVDLFTLADNIDAFEQGEENNNIENTLFRAQQIHHTCDRQQKILIEQYTLSGWVVSQEKQQLQELLNAIAEDLNTLTHIISQLGCSESTLVETESDVSQNELLSIKNTLEALAQEITDKQNAYKKTYVETQERLAQQKIEQTVIVIQSAYEKYACRALKLDPAENITWGQIRKAYKKEVLHSHVDKAPADEKETRERRFLEVTEAYKCLESLREQQDPAYFQEEYEYENEEAAESAAYLRMQAAADRLRREIEKNIEEADKMREDSARECREEVEKIQREGRERSARMKMESEQNRAKIQEEIQQHRAKTQEEIQQSRAKAQEESQLRRAKMQEEIQQSRAKAEEESQLRRAKHQMEMAEMERENERILAQGQADLQQMKLESEALYRRLGIPNPHNMDQQNTEETLVSNTKQPETKMPSEEDVEEAKATFLHMSI